MTVILALLAHVLFALSGGVNPDQATNTGSPLIDEKVVAEYRLTILPATKNVFVEAVIHGAQRSDIKGWVTGTSGLNPTIATSEPNKIRLAYTLAIPEKERLDSPDAALDESHFRSWGWNIFIYPTLNNPISQVNLSINVPEGWNAATSFGINHKQLLLPNSDELLNIAIVAGDFRVTTFESAGTSVYLAIRNGHKVADSAFVASLKKLIEGGVAYTGAKLPKNVMFGIDLLGEKKTYAPGNNVRTGSHSSILLIDRNNADPQDPAFFGTYAHEFSHSWIPAAFGNRSVTNKELGSVFKEGFTDYMAYRIAHSAGLHNREQLARAFTKFYLEYLDVASSVRDEQDAEFLRYRQGMIAAWVLDIELQRSSKGKHGFRELIQLLIKQHADTDGLTKQEFIAALISLGGERFAALYDRLTRADEVIDLSLFMRATGIKIRAVQNPGQALKDFLNGGQPVVTFAPADQSEKDFLNRFLNG